MGYNIKQDVNTLILSGPDSQSTLEEFHRKAPLNGAPFSISRGATHGNTHKWNFMKFPGALQSTLEVFHTYLSHMNVQGALQSSQKLGIFYLQALRCP